MKIILKLICKIFGHKLHFFNSPMAGDLLYVCTRCGLEHRAESNIWYEMSPEYFYNQAKITNQQHIKDMIRGKGENV